MPFSIAIVGQQRKDEMTREEFICHKAEGERFGKRIPWWIFACMWVAGVGWSVNLVILLVLHWSTEARSPILVELAVCALLIGVLPLFDGLWKRRLIKLDLQCPSCRSWLISKKGEAVLRDGKCGDCGTKIMDVPNQASEATSEPARTPAAPDLTRIQSSYTVAV